MSDLPHPSDSSDPSHPQNGIPAQKLHSDQGKSRWSFYLVALVVALFVMGIVTFVYSKFTAIVNTQAIGHVVRVAPSGGFGHRSTIETETGFYPLDNDIVASKGVALILVEERWGDRSVCNTAKTLCVATSPVGFELPQQGAKP
jgi:hypothetical protein